MASRWATPTTTSYSDTGLSVRDDVQLHRGGARCGGQCLVRLGECERHDRGYDSALGAHRPGGDGGRGHGGQPDLDCVHRQRRGDRLYRPAQRRPGGHPDHHELFGYRTDQRNDVQLHRGGARCGEQRLSRFDECQRHDRRHDCAPTPTGLVATRSRGDDDQPDLECLHRQRRGDRVYRPTQWRPGGHPEHPELFGYGLVGRNDVQLHRGRARCGEQRLARVGES